MADIATDLKQRFGWAMDLSLESYEVLPDGKSFVRSDRDEHAIGIFKNLRDSVDNIPRPLIEAAEAFRVGASDIFEQTLSRALQAIGIEPDPVNATEFLSNLNDVAQPEQRDVTSQKSGK